jgi:hypothetical protein
MTRSDDALVDLHSPTRRADMKDDYEGHGTPGWGQLLCAWFIILIVVALFKISDFISASRTAPFANATGIAQMADDIERWERGEPRQQTMTVPNAHKIVLMSRIDQ